MIKKMGLGGKKDLDAQLNLTPFIDLLSTCVCFLLITAVWIDVGSIEIKQSHGTEAAETKKESYDLDVVFNGPMILRLNLKKDGKQIKSIQVQSTSKETVLTDLQAALENQILMVKNQMIEIATTTLTPKSNVSYGEMISVLDVLRKNKIVNIGIVSNQGQ
jgi:biopolymer transport protein TolR